MSFSQIKTDALQLFASAPFIGQINNQDDYAKALQLMDELIEDYDQYLPLIDVLAASIERWENDAEEFSQFNQQVAELDSGIAVLKTLMQQHQLKADDLKAEIGSKSLVSMVLNGSRQLTKDHIQALSLRFKINPALFFSS